MLNQLQNDKLCELFRIDGTVDATLDEAFVAELISHNLAGKRDGRYVSTLPIFSREQDAQIAAIAKVVPGGEPRGAVSALLQFK
jgi:hypothetical protein